MSRLSIRMKILLVFMLLFTLAFGAAFFWFYQYATDMAMKNLQQSLITSAQSAARLVDPNELMQVYSGKGINRETGYKHIEDQLRLVLDIDPRATQVYTMVRSPNSDDEMLFVVNASRKDVDEVGTLYGTGAETSSEEITSIILDAIVGSPYDITGKPEMLAAFDSPTASPALRRDEYGVWLSGYAPVFDADGKSVAIVGVDMSAEDVIGIQARIRNISLLAFFLAYVGVFAAAYILSGAITKSLSMITAAAQSLEKDEPFDSERLAPVAGGKDELGQLARVFSEMAVQVQQREQKLKQEVVQLRIEIDETKRAKQVSEIADTEYFRDLQKKAKELRGQRKNSGE